MPFIEPSQLAAKELLPGWVARFFHSQHMTFAYTEIAKGASVHRHHHPNEEVWNVIEGELEITLDDETRTITAGGAAVVPGELDHSATAVTDCKGDRGRLSAA